MRRVATLCLVALSLSAQSRIRVPSAMVQAESVVDDAFFRAAISSFTIGTVLYVAPNQAGASCSNTGLSATFISGTNGPLLNLNCATARTALANGGAGGVQVILRAGTNLLKAGVGTYGTNGLALNGQGSATSPLILSAYPGDAAPVIDGEESYTYAQIHEVFTTAPSSTMDGVPFTISVRQILNISGSYVIVDSGIVLQNGFRHVVQISGTYFDLRNPTVSGAYEDALKVLVDARHIKLRADCSNFSSSCLDWFGAEYVWFTQSTCHDARQDPTTGNYVAVCAGVKGGGRFGAYTRNAVTSLASDGTHGALIMGGAPNTAIDRQDGSGNFLPSVRNAAAIGNTITNFFGVACQITGGVDAECSDNIVSGTLGLAKIGTDPDVRNADPMYATQPLTKNAILKRNRASYLPVKCSGVVSWDSCYGFYVANTAEAVGLVGDKNIYTTTAAVSPVYIYGGGQIDIAAFRTASGTENTSTVVAP